MYTCATVKVPKLKSVSVCLPRNSCLGVVTGRSEEMNTLIMPPDDGHASPLPPAVRLPFTRNARFAAWCSLIWQIVFVVRKVHRNPRGRRLCWSVLSWDWINSVRRGDEALCVCVCVCVLCITTFVIMLIVLCTEWTPFAYNSILKLPY